MLGHERLDARPRDEVESRVRREKTETQGERLGDEAACDGQQIRAGARAQGSGLVHGFIYGFFIAGDKAGDLENPRGIPVSDVCQGLNGSHIWQRGKLDAWQRGWNESLDALECYINHQPLPPSAAE